MTKLGNLPLQAIMITQQDFERLEAKIDQMAAALIKLIIVEERQSTQGIRIGEAEKTMMALQVQYSLLDKKLDQWINRGIGLWAFALFSWAVFKTIYMR